MRILIADDEKMIRKGIAQILSSQFPDDTFLEAQNGSVALDIIKAEHPEILLTDIKMPVMDGLELMKAVREMDREMAIVVVTGFDDFEYARTALRYEASAYILKPIEKLELIETVSQLISERKASSRERIERILGRCYADGGMSHEIRMDQSLLCPYRVVAVLAPRQYQERTEGLYHISPINHGYLALVRKDCGSEPEGMYLGYSQERNSLDDLDTAAIEAMSALYGRFLTKGETVFYSTGLGSISNDIAKKIGKIANQIGFASSSDIDRNVKALFVIPDGVDKPYYLFSLAEAIRNGLLSRFRNSDSSLLVGLCALSSYSDIEAWRDDLSSFLQGENEESRSRQPENTFIDKALAYIDANYSKNINMAVVSNEVGISYTYFSEKFKEHMKVNFNDYLTSFRIEKAKELLEQGYYRIYEVSEKCGFSGPRYFIKVFKQLTGITPTAYMTSHMKAD